MSILAAVRWAGSRLALFVVAAILALAVLAGGGLLLADLIFSRPSEHHNPSFRFGEKLMEDYGAFSYAPASASTQDACRAAVRRAPHRPVHLDEKEAVRGCMYTEFNLDN